MEYLKQAALLVLTPHCYDEYFIALNFLDVPCFKASLSKALGLGIIFFSILIKIPQIVKIYKNKSAEGISISSVSLDLTAITIYMSYSFVKDFPFSAWGDSLFVALQTVIIGAQVLFYGGSTAKALMYLVAYGVICAIMCGAVPVEFLWTLQGVNIPILLMGKLTQAYTNYKNGHTGQLSAATLTGLWAGSLARIFTSIQETGDFMVIVTYVASSLANSVLFGQLLYYWNIDISKKKGAKPKKKVDNSKKKGDNKKQKVH